MPKQIDPGIHAEMVILVRREKELRQEQEELKNEALLWRKRVNLAEEKGMSELATQAEERLEGVKQKYREIERECESIKMEKEALRYEHKRPDGLEVERAEMMVESVRLGGLIDPDEATFEAELEQVQRELGPEDSDVAFDFDD